MGGCACLGCAKLPRCGRRSVPQLADIRARGNAIVGQVARALSTATPGVSPWLLVEREFGLAKAKIDVFERRKARFGA